jgi:hypothetical protein
MRSSALVGVIDDVIGAGRAGSTGVAKGLTVLVSVSVAPRSAHNVPTSVQGLQPKALIVGDE